MVENNCTKPTTGLNELNFEEASSVQEEPIYNRPENYEYDQVAQEGKLSQSGNESVETEN